MWKLGVIHEKRFFGKSLHYRGGEEGRYIELSLQKGRLWFVGVAHNDSKWQKDIQLRFMQRVVEEDRGEGQLCSNISEENLTRVAVMILLELGSSSLVAERLRQLRDNGRG